MIDQEAELARFKGLLVAGIVFLVSGCYAYSELKYAIWGQMADAKVIRAEQKSTPGRRGRTHHVMRVEYEFAEANGTRRSEKDDVSVDWSPPGDGKISVQYIPGAEHSSRLEGQSHMFAVYLFLGCIVWLGYSLYQIGRQAHDDGRGSKNRRRG